jgi:single-stranded DNA-binding protein
MGLTVNKVVLVGQVTSRGPKIAWTEKGTAVCDFWLELAELGSDGATHRQYCPVVAYGKLGESTAEALEPGQTVLVDGRIGWMPRGAVKAGQKGESKLCVVARHVTAAEVPALTGDAPK